MGWIFIFFLCVKYKSVSQNTSESYINYINKIKIIFLQKDYIQKEIIYNRSDYIFQSSQNIKTDENNNIQNNFKTFHGENNNRLNNDNYRYI